MVKVSLFSYSKDKEAVMTKLHKLNIMQLIDLKSSDIELDNASCGSDLKVISDYLLRVSRLNNVLKIAPSKKGFVQNLYGLETMKKAIVKRKSKDIILSEAKSFLDKYEEKLLRLEKENAENSETLLDVEKTMQVVEVFKKHNLPISLLGKSKTFSFAAGKVIGTNARKIKNEIKKEFDGYYYFQSKEEDKDSIISIVTLKEYEAKLNFILKKYGVETFSLSKVPESEDTQKWVNHLESDIQKKISRNINEIKKFEKEALDTSIFLREELELLREKFDSIHKLKESKSFFVLQGWVTKEELSKLHKNMNECVIKEQDSSKKDNVPVELSNPWYLKPFEMLTELYALPKYKDLDPTFIVAPLFLIYAGFMLTDFVYGLGVLALGIVLFTLFKKQSKSMKYISINIMGIGIFAMIFGILTGSYLGDGLETLFGPAFSSKNLAIWNEPLSDPMYFLIMSLIVGFLHINSALVLGLIENIRNKEWKAVFFERLVWWILQAGIAFIALGFMKTFGWALLIIAVIMLVISNGPLGLLDITGFMGDVISYSRLFALALSTAGIAMTVNLLAKMLSDIPYVGIILAILLAVVGHLFSFFMNGLGSFVHSIRLQFVEFFGKFYEGGGDKFEKFKEERVYTEVEE